MREPLNQGKKHVNVYKKRIIESFLKNPSQENEHIHFVYQEHMTMGTISFEFTPVCEKLIEFCVEAERSKFLSYEKSITMLYDLFGFRKDEFDRLNNEEKYLSTMNDISQSTKGSILSYVTGDTIVDVGSGGGVLLDELEKRYPEKHIIGTDISTNVIQSLEKRRHNENHTWNVLTHNFVDGPLSTPCDSILFSSILHEVFSYTCKNGEKFERESVLCALKNAWLSLNESGRLIIRDGIKTNSKEKVKLKLHTKEGYQVFLNFNADFKGLKEIPRDFIFNEQELTVVGDINYIREFLYTYTWGNESYSHEVNEQFGYFTLQEFLEVANVLDANVITATEFLEEGYTEHLSPLVSLYDLQGNEISLPNSNCIIVLEK